MHGHPSRYERVDPHHDFLDNVFNDDNPRPQQQLQMQAGPPHVEQRPPPQNGVVLNGFYNTKGNMPGFDVTRDYNVKKWLGDRMNMDRVQGVPGGLSLGRASVHRNERHVVFGTYQPGPEQHLFCVDTENFMNSSARRGGESIVGTHRLPEAIQDVHWLSDDRLVASVGAHNGGQSTLQIYSANFDNGGGCTLEVTSQIAASAQEVREVAINSHDSRWLAYGGYDHVLSLMDLEIGGQVVREANVGGTIGSIKWSRFINNKYLSMTTDDGMFKMYDATTVQGAAVSYNTNRQHGPCFTHERISDWHVLLGFQDGTIQQIDIRMPDILEMSSIKDPFIPMIGNLSFRQDSNFLLASGLADFTAWHRGQETGQALLWCHSQMDENHFQNDDNSVNHAVFLNGNTVFSTQAGNMGVYCL